MTRRDLLAAQGFAGGGAGVAAACAPVPGPPEWIPPPPGRPDEGPFPDGVIAGDPAPDGSTIWTRVDPGGPSGDVAVVWAVALDAGFTDLLAGGTTTATAAGGHGVTVAATGLLSDRWYHYRFEALGAASRIGQLRTALPAGSGPDRLRFVIGSCQQLSSWFVPHRALAAEPGLDFVMHLGDYVCVSDTGTLTRQQYRDTYRHWRTQPELRDLHTRVPMVAMWDDGEFYSGVDATGPAERLSNATAGWFDSLPLVDPGDQRAYRSLGWGDLADIPMIDVRRYRDPASAETNYTSFGEPHEAIRSTLGATQFSWLASQLTNSTAAWRIIGNPYNMSPWKLVNLECLRQFREDLPHEAGIYAPNEAWDDYLRERRDLLSLLADNGITDTVFASARTHIFLTSELRIDDRPRNRSGRGRLLYRFSDCRSRRSDQLLPGPSPGGVRGHPRVGRAVAARQQRTFHAPHQHGGAGLHAGGCDSRGDRCDPSPHRYPRPGSGGP